MVDLINGLDSMHARVQVALPDAQMPEFFVVEHSDHLVLTYRSVRYRLASMVLGLLDGLAEKFNEDWLVEHVVQKNTDGCDVFHLRQAQRSAEETHTNAA